MKDHLFNGDAAIAPLSIEPGSAHVPASARVYDDLRRKIVELELPPDTVLHRSQLAEGYNVSQSPVREAILRLEQDGLVRSKPQSRTVVTRINLARIHEEHFLRLAVECEVVRRLAETYDPATIAKAKGFLRMQAALVGDVDQADLFRQLDEAFHEALFAGVNQTNLHRHIRSKSGHLARVRTLDLPKEGKMQSVLEGHQEIVNAIITRDGNHAAATMRRHLSGTIERIADLHREFPDYFSE
jgi:DNA-binding GntR family transcriptional regulator